MLNRHLARGVFLAAVALYFASGALRLHVGDLARAGPGLFPLIVSGMLLVLALITIAQSRLTDPLPLEFNVRSIGLIMLSLCAFVVLSHAFNAIAGIVALVFLASFAATSHSWLRSLQVSVGLIVVAFAFQRLLGLNLRLY